MEINKNLLEIAKRTIIKNDGNYKNHIHANFIKQSKFIDLYCILHTKIHRGEKNYVPLYKYVNAISESVYQIETLFSKLEWLKNFIIKHNNKDFYLREYIGIDLDYFFIKYISTFGYISGAITATFNNIPQFNEWLKKNYTNFSELKKYVENEVKNNRNLKEKIGDSFVNIISDTEWYDEFNEIRNAIVHKRGRTESFGVYNNMIVFQIETTKTKNITIDKLKFNEYTIYFDLYAGLYYGYLVGYLEKISELIIKKFKFKISKLRSASDCKDIIKKLLFTVIQMLD